MKALERANQLTRKEITFRIDGDKLFKDTVLENGQIEKTVLFDSFGNDDEMSIFIDGLVEGLKSI